LGLAVEKEDEISCLIKGANFLLKNVPDEAFVFERKGNPEYRFQSAGPVMYPYLLVNIGSGVSILKVEGEDTYQRIGGTATGGGLICVFVCYMSVLYKWVRKNNRRALKMLLVWQEPSGDWALY